MGWFDSRVALATDGASGIGPARMVLNPRHHSLALAGIPGLRLGASWTVARYDRTGVWGHEPGGLPPGAVEPVNEEASA